MTDSQIEKLLEIMERQTRALEKMANAIGTADESLNVAHADLCSEIKMLRRAEVLKSGISLCNEHGLGYENLNDGLKDAVKYVSDTTKTETFNNKTLGLKADVGFHENLELEEVAIKMAYGESLLCGKWNVSSNYSKYNGVDVG